MAMAKRIFLFLAVNFLVIITLSFLMNLLGVQPYLTQYGLDYQSLLIFCVIWGMGGAFISLLISKWMAKFAMRVKVIDPQTQDPAARDLVFKVHHLAKAAGLPKMPEVGVYTSPEVNAFATGPSRSNALVAVSSGLLQRMDTDEVEGVLGHEIAHIANGDMVTMTLLQGVVNAFVMFLARIIAFAITNAGRGNNNRDEGIGGSPFMYYMITMALEMVLMIFGSMLVAWFSRYREFRADAGGARFAGREKMIRALEKLQSTVELNQPGKPSFQSFKISGGRKGMIRFFASHPPLSERIERLRMGAR